MQTHENEFTVTLVSNASTDIYPNNHVFNFTNVLAKTLVFPRNENWRVCLQSISLTNINDEPEFVAAEKRISNKTDEFEKSLKKIQSTLAHSPAEMIKATEILFRQSKKIIEDKLEIFNTVNALFIECDQIIPKYESQRILSSFIVPPTHSKLEFYHYEPTHEEYFNLASTDINRFSIKILNANKEKILRTASQPTILVLKFKKMGENINSYSITVNNEDSPPEKFYAKLPMLDTLGNLNTDWEMAVSRVSFIPLLKKFPSGTYSINLITDVDDFVSQLTPQTWDKYLADKPHQSVNLRYNENFSAQTLLAPIGEAIESLFKKNGKIVDFEFNDSLYLMLKVKTDGMTEKEKNTPYLLTMPEELIYVLGFDNEGIVFNNGYGALPCTYAKVLTARRQYNVNFLVPQNLLLYIDCVKPSLVGNAYGKYLTNIPVPIKTEKNIFDLSYVTYEPKNLEFHPLHQSTINRVLIQLLKVDGNPPEFVTDQIKIFISFLIRKKRKY